MASYNRLFRNFLLLRLRPFPTRLAPSDFALGFQLTYYCFWIFLLADTKSNQSDFYFTLDSVPKKKNKHNKLIARRRRRRKSQANLLQVSLYVRLLSTIGRL